MKEQSVKQVAKLLLESGKAHHQAFIETDGADDEWPLWYANYLQKRMSTLLKHKFTVSDLVYWLIKLDKEAKPAENEHWTVAYAKILVNEFL